MVKVNFCKPSLEITGKKDIDQILNLKMSDSFISFCKIHAKRHNKICTEIRKSVKALVKARNKIFKSLQELHDFRKGMEGAEEVSFKKEDQMKLAETFQELDQKG